MFLDFCIRLELSSMLTNNWNLGKSSKTIEIRQKRCFCLQDAPNSCQQTVETSIIHPQTIPLRFALDSEGHWDNWKCINSVLGFSWFWNTLKLLWQCENRCLFIQKSEKAVVDILEFRGYFFWRFVSGIYSEIPFCTFWVPYIQIRQVLAEKNWFLEYFHRWYTDVAASRFWRSNFQNGQASSEYTKIMEN